MGFKDLKISVKLLTGFLIVAALIVVAGLMGIWSNADISSNYIAAQDLSLESQFLDKKLNDHYVWMQGITDQFLSNEEFQKQVDPTKCGFGGWYYEFINSDKYHNLPSETKKIIDSLEEPHKKLHETGHIIKESHNDLDISLDGFLAEKEGDHLKWMNGLRDTWQDNNKVFDKTTDPTKCGFGKWYYDFIRSDVYENLPSDVKKAIDEMEELHKNLHYSAEEIMPLAGTDKKITDEETKEKAMHIYQMKSSAYADEMMDKFKIVREYIKSIGNKKQEAINTYNEESKAHIAEIVLGFNEYQGYVVVPNTAEDKFKSQ